QSDEHGIGRVRLQQVESIDSAGIALLAALAARNGEGLVVEGAPAGLAELRDAYRLDDRLRFACAMTISLRLPTPRRPARTALLAAVLLPLAAAGRPRRGDGRA